MQIDVISDVVCPWCYIGKRRLERALEARPGAAAEVVWRPFQLNPDMPEEGRDQKEYYLEKFGSREEVDRLTEAMATAGETEGIAFDFGDIPKAPNTLAAHRLVRWAASAGVQDAVVEALFRAYFLEARDIGDHATLIAIGAAAGMEEDLLRELYAEGRDIDLVKDEISRARSMGVNGVPCFIFGGSYVVQGAQDPSYFLPLIDALAAEPPENPEIPPPSVN